MLVAGNQSHVELRRAVPSWLKGMKNRSSLKIVAAPAGPLDASTRGIWSIHKTSWAPFTVK